MQTQKRVLHECYIESAQRPLLRGFEFASSLQRRLRSICRKVTAGGVGIATASIITSSGIIRSAIGISSVIRHRIVYWRLRFFLSLKIKIMCNQIINEKIIRK